MHLSRPRAPSTRSRRWGRRRISRWGDYYDGLAEVAAEEADFVLAVRAQRRAIELGYKHLELGRDMLAWYLLKAGDRDEGEAAFARRQYCRFEHGLPPDEDDRLAEPASSAYPVATHYS